MRSLVGMLMVLMVSGDDNVSHVTGSVGGDVLLPCSCPNRESKFRWQADESVLVVEHTEDPSDLRGEYKDRAELFLSEDSSNCSLLLKNITLEDEGKYICSFKFQEGPHNYSYVNLTVSEMDPNTPAESFAHSPVPTEPTPPHNIRTLWLVMPVALVAVLSLFLFFLYKRKVSGQLNAGEEERELRISV